MEKVHVIVNPFSARGQTARRWQQILSAIRGYYREFKYVFTEKPQQATKIARELLKAGFDLLIGVGGDGTLNEIGNGFFREHSSEAINPDASLAIIPSGTGSDFIRFLKIPRDFRQSVASIKNSVNKRIDIGKITYRPAEEGSRHQYFLNVADFGLGAEVVRGLASIPQQKRSALCYYQGLLRTIRSYHSHEYEISLDGGPAVANRFLIGAIANGGIFGGGMKIAPAARVDDGLFDVVLIEDMRPLEIMANSPHLYLGTIARQRKVKMLRAKTVQVSSPADVGIEYDGETGGLLPAEFTIVPGAINFRQLRSREDNRDDQ